MRFLTAFWIAQGFPGLFVSGKSTRGRGVGRPIPSNGSWETIAKIDNQMFLRKLIQHQTFSCRMMPRQLLPKGHHYRSLCLFVLKRAGLTCEKRLHGFCRSRRRSPFETVRTGGGGQRRTTVFLDARGKLKRHACRSLQGPVWGGASLVGPSSRSLAACPRRN